MISTLLTLLIVTAALVLYSVLLVMVFGPVYADEGFREGYDEGLADGQRLRQAQR